MSHIRTLETGSKVHLNNPGSSHFEVLNLINSPKTLSPNKVMFAGSGMWTYLFGGQPSVEMQVRFVVTRDRYGGERAVGMTIRGLEEDVCGNG